MRRCGGISPFEVCCFPVLLFCCRNIRPGRRGSRCHSAFVTIVVFLPTLLPTAVEASQYWIRPHRVVYPELLSHPGGIAFLSIPLSARKTRFCPSYHLHSQYRPTPLHPTTPITAYRPFLCTALPLRRVSTPRGGQNHRPSYLPFFSCRYPSDDTFWVFRSRCHFSFLGIVTPLGGSACLGDPERGFLFLSFFF
jgi:hypothetical protein